MNKAIPPYNPASFSRNLPKFAALEQSRKKTKNLRWKSIENLDRYLVEFEASVVARGGKVWWANNTEEAQGSLKEIIGQVKNQAIRFSKNAKLLSEVSFPPFLISQGWSQQNSNGESDITCFKEPANDDETVSELKISDVFVCDADYIVAENGSVASSTNDVEEHKASVSADKLIVLCDIFDLIPTESDLNTLLPLKFLYRSGELLSSTISLFRSHKRIYEFEGNTSFDIILIDNGRSRLLIEPEQREASFCIDCDACQRVCPVYSDDYKTTSGHNGPYGAMVNGFINGWETHQNDSRNSSLCGECSLNCPVHIDIHKVLLFNRRDTVESGYDDFQDDFSWKFWKSSLMSRRKMNLGFSSFSKRYYNMVFKRALGFHESNAPLSEESFSTWWKKKRQ